ncbi:MAG: ParB/RepB/Spo0J family partition protein [Alphaproteobacteria bacterium]
MTDDSRSKITKRRLGRGLDALFGEETAAEMAPSYAPSARETVNHGISSSGTAGTGVDNRSSAPAGTHSGAGDRRVLPIEALRPNRYQPRRHFNEDALRELTASIRQHGILQPIVVRPDPDHGGQFEIIAGERRWRAAQAAQLHHVPVVITALSNRGALEVALIENIQRQDLDPLEEAEAFRRLMTEFSHTQEKLADAVGKSRSHIANTLRLLSLPEGSKPMCALVSCRLAMRAP